MGLSVSKLFDALFRKKETKILMFGLDAAGKTTILYKLKLGETVNTIPTIGFNVETVKHKKISFTVWDIPPRENLKPLIRHYFPGTHGLIFVVDSHDCERIDEAKTDLLALIRADELRDIPILVFANKKDIGLMSAEEIREKLELNKRKTDSWHIQESNALTGDGLSQGLEWLSQAIVKKRQ